MCTDKHFQTKFVHSSIQNFASMYRKTYIHIISKQTEEITYFNEI